MAIASIPIILGLLIGTLPEAGRSFAFWTALTIFALLVLSSIANWGALFSGIGLLVTIAYPFVVLISAVIGFVLRVIFEEITA